MEMRNNVLNKNKKKERKKIGWLKGLNLQLGTFVTTNFVIYDFGEDLNYSSSKKKSFRLALLNLFFCMLHIERCEGKSIPVRILQMFRNL